MSIKDEVTIQLLDTALNAAQDGIIIYRSDMSVLYANKALLNLCGITEDVFLKKSWTNKELHEAGYFHGNAAQDAFRSGKRITTNFVNALGLHLLCTATPIFGEGDTPCGVVTNVRDITKLFELQQKLHEKKEQLGILRSMLGREESFLPKRLISVSPKMRLIVDTIDRIAPTDISILLQGESGVGKSELAERVHQKSHRASKPLVVVNCGAIPPSLFESEFFGYEKGAFTGADKAKKGLFEEANGSTLLLDEVGELPLMMQVKLLRVIQEGKVKRLGAQKELAVNVRIVAATNQNLQEKVKQGTFREDLYHRLNIIKINIPPLRERKEDLKQLISYFLTSSNAKYNMKKTMSPQLVSKLEAYNWPGNTRELAHLIEGMVVLSTTEEIGIEYLPEDFQPVQKEEEIPLIPLQDACRQAEHALLLRAKKQLGSTRRMAEVLQVSHVTISRKLKEFGIE